MKNKRLTIGLAALATALLTSYLPVYSQESSSSASSAADLDLESIKENVKRRIQEVVNTQDKSDTDQTPTAYMGMLTSIANLTLTIESKQGVKLASTSAETSYIALPDNDSIEFDLLSLDDYIVALGFLDDSQVLITKRVIVEDQPLKDPLTNSFYGLTIPSEDVDILIQNPHSNEQFSCKTTKSTKYEAIENDIRQQIEAEDILPLTPTMIIYEPDEDEPETSYCLNILQNSSAQAPNVNLSPAATPSAQQPPELP